VASSLQQFRLDNARRVDRVNLGRHDTHTPITHRVRYPIPETRKERFFRLVAKEPLDISQTGHLEQLGFPHDHLAKVVSVYCSKHLGAHDIVSTITFATWSGEKVVGAVVGIAEQR
jgi:hypothetical protein